jgi:hypothetical protein
MFFRTFECKESITIFMHRQGREYPTPVTDKLVTIVKVNPEIIYGAAPSCGPEPAGVGTDSVLLLKGSLRYR